MLVGFFLHLKACKLPVSTREFLTLLEALDERVVSTSLTDFYTLARATLVKDEQHFDRFDVAFGTYFNGIESVFDVSGDIPDEWLRRELELKLSDEDKRLVAVENTRSIRKKDLVLNDHQPEIEVDSQTYEVRADGELLRCEPATVLPLAQRYFLF